MKYKVNTKKGHVYNPVFPDTQLEIMDHYVIKFYGTVKHTLNDDFHLIETYTRYDSINHIREYILERIEKLENDYSRIKVIGERYDIELCDYYKDDVYEAEDGQMQLSL